jgi:hypothetical protein
MGDSPYASLGPADFLYSAIEKMEVRPKRDTVIRGTAGDKMMRLLACGSWQFARQRYARPPVKGRRHKFDTDPNEKDHLLFYNNFHSDTGLGESHQTGWTAFVSSLIDAWR